MKPNGLMTGASGGSVPCSISQLMANASGATNSAGNRRVARAQRRLNQGRNVQGVTECSFCCGRGASAAECRSSGIAAPRGDEKESNQNEMIENEEVNRKWRSNLEDQKLCCVIFFRKDNFFNCNDCKEFIGIQASFKTQIILAEVLVLFALQKTKLRIPERSELTGVLFALQKTKLR